MAESVGVALLLLFPFFAPLLAPDHLVLYHHFFFFGSLVGGLLLDLLGASLLGFALLIACVRLPRPLRLYLAAELAGFLLWRAAGDFITSFLAVFQWQEGVRRPLAGFLVDLWNLHSHLVLLGFLSLALLLALALPRVAGLFVRGVRLGITSVCFCLLWIIPQCIFLALAPHRAPAFDLSSAAPPPQTELRVVWVLFDELSYKLTFDEPKLRNSFPNFQQLKTESISFAKLSATGVSTDRVIPSLLLGRNLSSIRSTWRGKLLSYDSANRHWREYNPSQSLFGEAREHGWNPAVAGWYNPYCRVFASVLTTCSWTPGIQMIMPIETYGASGNKSAFANALALPIHFFERLSLNQSDRTDERLLLQNVADFQSVMNRARSLIDNPNLHFVFIHLPLPHPPGLYDRRTHQLCACGNYLDNLALADRTLGEFRQRIEQSPLAAHTILVVSSDHSWRVPIWRFGGDWTDEEEQISQGKFDTRPVFLVHFPGQKEAFPINAPLSELAEHRMISSILTGEVDEPTELLQQLTQAASGLSQPLSGE